jgi:hypothetical protein
MGDCVRCWTDARTWKTFFGSIENGGEGILLVLARNDKCAAESVVQNLVPGRWTISEKIKRAAA